MTLASLWVLAGRTRTNSSSTLNSTISSINSLLQPRESVIAQTVDNFGGGGVSDIFVRFFELVASCDEVASLLVLVLILDLSDIGCLCFFLRRSGDGEDEALFDLDFPIEPEDVVVAVEIREELPVAVVMLDAGVRMPGGYELDVDVALDAGES